MSIRCAWRSPWTPLPAVSFFKRQTSGKLGSAIQSCKYVPRQW